MITLKQIHLILFFILIALLLALPDCKSGDNSARFTQGEQKILDLASRSKTDVEDAKEVMAVFNKVLESKDIQLLLPYRSMLERQYNGDRAVLEKVSELFSAACLESLEEMTESINCYKDDTCGYTPAGFLESPSDEKKFKYFLQLGRYHARFIECSLEASKEIIKKKDT